MPGDAGPPSAVSNAADVNTDIWRPGQRGRPLPALHLCTAALFDQLAPGQELGQGLAEDAKGDGKTCAQL